LPHNGIKTYCRYKVWYATSGKLWVHTRETTQCRGSKYDHTYLQGQQRKKSLIFKVSAADPILVVFPDPNADYGATELFTMKNIIFPCSLRVQNSVLKAEIVRNNLDTDLEI
jgi:hypothetical protein